MRSRRRRGENRRARSARSSRARNSAYAEHRADRAGAIWHNPSRSLERWDRAVNYRHVFHAGSFADVFKHAVLCRILHYLRGKQAPFRVIDTHAGAGLYDLTSAEASRGGEWDDGIERLLAGAASASRPGAAGALSGDVIGALNERGA